MGFIVWTMDSSSAQNKLPTSFLRHSQEMGQSDLWELRRSPFLLLYLSRLWCLCAIQIRHRVWRQIVELFTKTSQQKLSFLWTFFFCHNRASYFHHINRGVAYLILTSQTPCSNNLWKGSLILSSRMSPSVLSVMKARRHSWE